MWDTQSFWFDIALIFGIFAIGNILLGHFEEHRPKWRRLLKVVIVLGLALCLSYFRLRWVTYAILVMFAVGAGYIHLVWLPKNGIDGWTGEPKQKYYDLLGVKRSASQSQPENAE